MIMYEMWIGSFGIEYLGIGKDCSRLGKIPNCLRGKNASSENDSLGRHLY